MCVADSSRKRKASEQDVSDTGVEQPHKRPALEESTEPYLATGLKNFSGVACHLNAVVQCINAIDVFRNSLTSEVEKTPLGLLIQQMNLYSTQPQSAKDVMMCLQQHLRQSALDMKDEKKTEKGTELLI